MDRIGLLTLICLIKLVSSANVSTTVNTKSTPTPAPTPTSISTPTSTPNKNEVPKTSRIYQVTENIIDIPDNRTLPPIVPAFGLATPLNFGNNTVAVNNIIEQTSGKNSEENSEKSSEENNNTGQKKNSFSILHIKAEYDETPTQNNQNVFSKVFGGIKDYMYSFKRCVVDGLHSFFHKHDGDNDKSEESTFQNKVPIKHNKFLRNFDGVEDFGHENDYYDDDELKEHFGDY